MGSELLFCETFNHEGSEELHVDLVRFACPVLIREVRIVFQEQIVLGNINELERIGQTRPSSFTLDVYFNDSTNPLAPTFDHMGTIECQDETTALVIKPKTSADLVVMQGFYTVLTICLYGNVAPPPSAPSFITVSSSSPRSRSGSPYSDSGSGSGYSDDDRSPERREGGASPERAGGEGQGEGGEGGGSKFDDLFEPFSPVNSPDHLFDLSDDEATGKRTTTTPGGYEEFSDEEIAFGDDDFDAQDSALDSYLYSEDAWMTSSVSFKPFQCDFQKLESFQLQTETPHEVLLAKLQKQETSSKRSVSDEGSKLRDAVLKPKDISTPQKWVELMEEVPLFLYPGLAQLQKKSNSDVKEVLQKLVGWTIQCLSLDTARQMSPAVSVRQLKAGMRMVPGIAALGRKCTHMLVKHSVMEALCKLVSAEHMASSLRLLALRAIDSLLDYPQGLERFLGWSGKSMSPKGETPYQQMLNVVLSQPTVRVSAAVSSLLKKAHIYELLANVQQATDKVIACTPVRAPTSLPEDFWNIEGEEQASGTEDDDQFGLGEVQSGRGVHEEAMEVQQSGKGRQESDQSGEAMEEEEEGSQDATPTPIPPEVVARIVSCLEELKKLLEEAPHTIIQAPVKAFPTTVQYFPNSRIDYFPAVLQMFKARRLLECLLVLVTAPSTALDLAVFAAVRNLLLHFLLSQQGMLFLSSNPPIVNALTRALTQTVENEMPLNAMQPLTEFLSEESADSCTAQNLGLLLIYHLQVLQSLDVLRKAPKTTMTELESSENLSALHTLYSMTLAPIGKSAMAYVLSLENNITALLPFVEPRGQREHDNKLMKSSVSSRYAAVLILQLLQSPVRGDFLFSYGSRLLGMANFFKENSSPTMSDLHNWIHPVKELDDSPKTIPKLVNLIKELLPQMSCSQPGRASAPILTSLRLLLCLVSPPDHLKERQKDLKRMQAIISLFSAGAMDMLNSLLQKLSDIVLPVWSQRQPLQVAHANTLVLLALLAIRVVKTLLVELLTGTKHQYRDTRIVGTLLTLHTILCSAPYSGVISNAAPEIQSLIVDVLVVFTKPEVTVQEGEEKSKIDASGSCWCLMLQELLKHTLSAPSCFLSGVMILSELLPLPLPLHSTRPSTEADLRTVQCLRRLWALHLAPFTAEVSELLHTLSGSSCTTLQQALRRLCAQLADLSPTLASLIARLVIRTIIGEVEKQLEPPEGEEDSQKAGGEKKNPNSCLLRMLTTCAVLCQQPVFKIAVLDLIRQKETSETMNFSRFIPLLLFLVQKKETAVSAKLCVMSMLNALCNIYVSLTLVEVDDSPLSDQQYADCLPGQSQLEHITSAVLGHMTSPDQSLATVATGLKVLLSICQCNPGLVHLYGLLSSNLGGVSQLLLRITESLKSSSPPSPDVLSCVSLFLELLQLLLMASLRARLEAGTSHSSSRHDHGETKTLHFPKEFLKNMLVQDDGADLLLKLREAIQESYKEDESLLEGLLAPIGELMEAFADVKPTKLELPVLEHRLWPEMQSVRRQFETRTGTIVTDTTASSPEYWLATPPHDESELEPDTTTVDLPALASQSCNGLNLEEELKKRLLPSPPRSKPNERKRKLVLSVEDARKRLKEAMEQRLAAGRGKDVFRMRKQNTSRPPSMHVDDFMAIGVRQSGMGRGGRGGTMSMHPYMAPHHHPSAFMQSLGAGGRWMSGVTAGMGQYQRRDIGLGGLRTWDSRLSHPFLASPHMKPAAPTMRTAMWSQLQEVYRRESRMPWLGRQPVGGRSSEDWKSRQIYKRLV